MKFSAFWQSFFKPRKVSCLEASVKDDEDLADLDQETIEENEFLIPSYRNLGTPIRNVLLETPGTQINGFLLSLNTMINPQFGVTQEVSMAPKKGREGGQIPEMFLMGKAPFYSLAAQYHHAHFTPTSQKHFFTLMGRIDSQGQVQTILYKPMGRRSHMRCMAMFPNSNPDMAQFEGEIEGQLGEARYGIVANSEVVESSFVQKLGSRLLVAAQLSYLHMARTFAGSFLLRFSRNSSEKYYAQFSETTRSASLSLVSRIDDKTTIVTDLQVAGEGLGSTAGIGYRRRNKNFEVTSAVRTNGDMKSIFSYSSQSAVRLRLFLGGNVFHEDFKTGYQITVGGEE